MRLISITGWVFVAASFLTMLFGHLGEHELSWMSAQISTYAALAPYDYFITSSMVFSSISLIIVGILVSRYQIVGDSYLTHLVPAISGSAASGLIMLAYFEETARTLSMLKQSGFWAIRVQSFHDAGLLIFFYGSLVLVVLLGLLVIRYTNNTINRVTGAVILGLGPAAYLLMTTTWPKMIGFHGVATGVNQRAALFLLWLSIVLILLIASGELRKPAVQQSGATGKNAG